MRYRNEIASFVGGVLVGAVGGYIFTSRRRGAVNDEPAYVEEELPFPPFVDGELAAVVALDEYRGNADDDADIDKSANHPSRFEPFAVKTRFVVVEGDSWFNYKDKIYLHYLSKSGRFEVVLPENYVVPVAHEIDLTTLIASNLDVLEENGQLYILDVTSEELYIVLDGDPVEVDEPEQDEESSTSSISVGLRLVE